MGETWVSWGVGVGCTRCLGDDAPARRVGDVDLGAVRLLLAWVVAQSFACDLEPAHHVRTSSRHEGAAFRKFEMGSGNSALSKGAAPTSEAEAEATFQALDTDGDGVLGADELKAGIAKHGKLCKAKWTDAKITETICKFDVDGDGKLDRDEYAAVLADLKDPRCWCIPAAPRNAPGQWEYFLSHVQREAGIEAVQLQSEWGKKQCWLDRNMKDKSEAAMHEGVQGSNFFVCILSDSYFKSAYCCKEMQWAFAAGKKVLSCYKVGSNVGAILQEAPETYRAAISAIDSTKLDCSDPDYFEVGLKKLRKAAEAAVAREAEAKRAEAEAEAEAAAEAGPGGGSSAKAKEEPATGGYEHGGAKKGGASAQAQAVVTVFHKGGAAGAEQLRAFCVAQGALPDNVMVSDIGTDEVARDGMWTMVRASGAGNSVNLPLVAVGGPHISGAHRVFFAPSAGELDDVAAALAGDEGIRALEAKQQAKEEARKADLARRDGDLKKGLVDIRLAWEGSDEALARHPGGIGRVAGVYRKEAAQAGGRSVYTKAGDERSKLHFVESHAMWFVGPQPGKASGCANASDAAAAPDMIAAAWEVIRKEGGGWVGAAELVARRVNAAAELESEAKERLARRRARGVVVFGRPQCPLSNAFEQLLKSHGVKYKAVNVDTCDAYWDMEAAAVKQGDPPPKGALLPTIDAGGKGFYGRSPWEHHDMMKALAAAREAAEAAE